MTLIVNVAVFPKESVRLYTTSCAPMLSLLLLAGDVVMVTSPPELSVTSDGNGRLTVANGCPGSVGITTLDGGVYLGGSMSGHIKKGKQNVKINTE